MAPLICLVVPFLFFRCGCHSAVLHRGSLTGLRGNRPHYVGQVLIAKGRRLLEFIEFHFDFDVALLAFHLSFATGFGHEVRAREV